MRCPKCNGIMSNVMHFEKDKDYAFNLCDRCQILTHKKRIHYDEKKDEKKNDKKGDHHDKRK